MVKLADIVSLDRARRLRVDNTNGPELVVAWWRCRGMACIAQVGVTQSAIDAADMFDKLLASQRDKPIDREKTMFCESCAAAWHLRDQLKTRGIR